MSRLRRWFRESDTIGTLGLYLKYGIILFTAYHVTSTHFFTIATCDGISMLPTISQHRPSIFVNVWGHRRGRNLQVGDVIVFKHPIMERARACKRVVGMPGDFISVVTAPRSEIDLSEETPAEASEMMVQVPEGHCWVAGDNLDWSRDSRIFGPVPLALVVGKVERVVWPWKQVGRIENGLADHKKDESRKNIEWKRPTSWWNS